MYHRHPPALSTILGENYSKYFLSRRLNKKTKQKNNNWDLVQKFKRPLHQPCYLIKNFTWSNHFASWTHLKHLHHGTLLFTHTLAGFPWKQGIYCSSLHTKCCSLTADQARPCDTVPRMRHCLNQLQTTSCFRGIL